MTITPACTPRSNPAAPDPSVDDTESRPVSEPGTFYGESDDIDPTTIVQQYPLDGTVRGLFYLQTGAGVTVGEMIDGLRQLPPDVVSTGHLEGGYASVSLVFYVPDDLAQARTRFAFSETVRTSVDSYYKRHPEQARTAG